MDDQNPWGTALGLFGSICLVLAFILFGLSQTSDSLATSGLSATQLGIAAWFGQAGVTGLVGFLVVRAFGWQAARRGDQAGITADVPDTTRDDATSHARPAAD